MFRAVARQASAAAISNSTAARRNGAPGRCQSTPGPMNRANVSVKRTGPITLIDRVGVEAPPHQLRNDDQQDGGKAAHELRLCCNQPATRKWSIGKTASRTSGNDRDTSVALSGKSGN